ncbi:MAG: SMP-30/gluconolactonase/LRE family protein [Planctomycetota bacterium]|nr:SMP-30/gluconolactonase/LRE family protein [Planctomycetota bacterium]
MRRIWIPALLLLLFPPAIRAQDMALSTILIDGENWQMVSSGHRFTEGPAVDSDGRVYFTDVPESKIFKIDLDGKVTLFAENTANTNGLMFGPDGKLYGCRNGEKKIVAYNAKAEAETIADEVQSNDLVVAGNGSIWFTDPPGKRVWHIAPDRKKTVVAEGINPNGIILWPDQGTIVVTEGQEAILWTFRVERDGTLTNKDRYYGPLQLPSGADRPGSDGMTVDAVGRLYVTTRAGLQMFDPTGRLGGAIAKPQAGPLSNVCFGGPKLDTLYVTAGDKVFRRKIQANGVRYGK